MSNNFDALKLAVEATMPNNTVLYDDKGLPSIMVRIPKFKISDVIEGGSENTHPAFIVDGVEKDALYISKYQNIVVDGRAYSLPMQDPHTYVNFDQAIQYSEAKGEGWHLMSNAEWAAIALWARKNGTMPRGNNSYGADHAFPYETGIETFPTGDRTARVATGSGPVTWAHNHQADGIFDMNGNVWEWMGGYRTNEGEIQVIPDNNVAITGTNQTADSSLWKAIMPDGSLVAPGTAGTLKYDTSGKLVTSGEGSGAWNTTFESLGLGTDISEAPEILKVLALHPADNGDHGSDRYYADNTGERLGRRGGTWAHTSNAGVFSLYGHNSRASSYSNIGFRSAFLL